MLRLVIPLLLIVAGFSFNFFVNYDMFCFTTADKAKKEIERLRKNGYKKAYKEAVKNIYHEIKEAIKRQYDSANVDLWYCLTNNIKQPTKDDYKQFMFDIGNRLEKDGFSVKFVVDYNIFTIKVKW
jgi:RNAse (barnase) inhibitor barstar